MLGLFVLAACVAVFVVVMLAGVTGGRMPV